MSLETLRIDLGAALWELAWLFVRPMFLHLLLSSSLRVKFTHPGIITRPEIDDSLATACLLDSLAPVASTLTAVGYGLGNSNSASPLCLLFGGS